MIFIQITAEIAGNTWITKELGGHGQYKTVPSYRMHVWSDKTDRAFEFEVSRDSSAVVFGEVLPGYGPNGECPPCPASFPYHGKLHSTEKFAFAIRIFASWCTDTIHLYEPEGTLRVGILIHGGPARSEGCFTVTGGPSGFADFERAIRKLAAFETNAVDPDIRVNVEQRKTPR